MSTQLRVVFQKLESVRELTRRLAQSASDLCPESGELGESDRARLFDQVEVLRSRLGRTTERDPRSLFDIDERLVDLMDRIEGAAAENPVLPAELLQEATDYVEVFQSKVDRIAGYWCWQESIAGICGEEMDRLAARKNAAEARACCSISCFQGHRKGSKVNAPQSVCNRTQLRA